MTEMVIEGVSPNEPLKVVLGVGGGRSMKTLLKRVSTVAVVIEEITGRHHQKKLLDA